MTAFEKAWDFVKTEPEDGGYKSGERGLYPMGGKFSTSGDFDADPDGPESGLWDGFDPNHDTCSDCGGQMNPHWSGYGPDGPENGNCAGELENCDINLLFRQAVEKDGLNVGHYWTDEWARRWIVESRMKGDDPIAEGYGGEMIPCESCGSPYNQGGCEECR